MADSASPPGVGDPASVQKLADAAEETAGRLDRLRATVNSDVTATVPDMYNGASASALTNLWMKLSRNFFALGAELIYAHRLKDAAAIMADARRKLDEAQRFADGNGLSIGPDLTVTAWNPDDPAAGARVAAGQSMVNDAESTAAAARQKIKDANDEYERVYDDEMEDGPITAFEPNPGGRLGGRTGPKLFGKPGKPAVTSSGGSGGRPPGRPPVTGSPPVPPRKNTVADLVQAIRASPKRLIGKVDPPAHWPPTAADGTTMHNRIAPVVQRDNPGTQLPYQTTGPDLPVTGQSPGTTGPGVKYFEIKPDTDSGVTTYVTTQMGSSAQWSGPARLITYDKDGNVYEIDHPLNTGPWPPP